MEFGVCVQSHVGDIGYVVRAEALGFSHAWLADSQMLWSDCYAALALAATRTERIRLGTGVAVSGTRPAAVHAAGIATINALAPGRTFCGVGAGNTAMRLLGQPPHRIRAFDRYLAALRPLLRGEEAGTGRDTGDDDARIRHLMPDHGFVNFRDPIPLYVSGFGPRSLGLAGRHGDGAVLPMPRDAAVMEALWQPLEAGALAAGRTLERERFATTGLTTISVLDPGEAVDSPRVKRECGPMAMATVHHLYEQWRNFGHEPPPLLAEMWPAYRAQVEAEPPASRHQRIHAGHNCWVIPEEEVFLTPDLLAATCWIGTRDALLERLAAIAGAGLRQVLLLPGWDARVEVLERVARDLVPAAA